ncbi:MAG: ABC transporter [Legionellales bacterium RIFCSPHIGHO2_12_FULL_35_11]|nr:MAG: ABC transporter [Legionellales bacterium RIFCSPHIGHO2_12_FULL_35_11]
MTQNDLALDINNLYKTYKNGVNALKGISLTVKKGDFFALLGANGAGKSTTIGLISSLLTKSAGRILINGYDLDKNPEMAKVSIGVVPQELNLNIFETCEQVLTSQAGYYGISYSEAKPRAEYLLKELGLWDKRDNIVRHLSGGMKRRLMIARALMHKPSLLILDEPTAGVDIEIRRSMWEFLTKTNEDGTTIILTTHYLEEAEQMCKNVAIIDNGVLIENTSMKELLSSLHHQTFIFNTSSSIGFLPDFAPFTGNKIDANTIELRVENKYCLNDVFKMFDKHEIKINSMRNKTNRLEELFMDLITTS